MHLLPAEAPLRPSLLLTVALSACGAPTADGTPDDTTPTCTTDGEHDVVVSQLLFSRSADGVSAGFDLDGEVSVSGGSTGCGVADDVAPDGTPGIDNAFAQLLPVLELTEASAAEEIIHEAVNRGQLLLLLRLTGVDDLQEDDCVGLELIQAKGIPQVGGTGFLVADQTFDQDPEVPGTKVADLAIHQGVLEAGPFSFHLPVSILNANLDIAVLDAEVRLTFDDQGGFTGLLAGGIDVNDLLVQVTSQGVSQQVLNLVSPLLAGLTDLAPDADGTCTRLSVTLQVSGVSAFVFPTATDTGGESDVSAL